MGDGTKEAVKVNWPSVSLLLSPLERWAGCGLLLCLWLEWAVARKNGPPIETAPEATSQAVCRLEPLKIWRRRACVCGSRLSVSPGLTCIPANPGRGAPPFFGPSFGPRDSTRRDAVALSDALEQLAARARAVEQNARDVKARGRQPARGEGRRGRGKQPTRTPTSFAREARICPTTRSEAGMTSSRAGRSTSPTFARGSPARRPNSTSIWRSTERSGRKTTRSTPSTSPGLRSTRPSTQRSTLCSRGRKLTSLPPHSPAAEPKGR